MANIISAIINLVENPITLLKDFYKSKNRANNMGEALEEYIKDLFASSINLEDAERNRALMNTFSYTGNQNNPPDAMLIGGDAIEIKKIESPDSSLALNSSYPKAKLYANSHMITKECRNAEVWDVKDMIYSVGVVSDSKISSLCMVYGVDYAADAEIYERIKTTIKDGIETINDVEFAETKELGRVNRVDPLGITYLRIRGMWGIENPFSVFKYLFTRNPEYQFNFMAVINTEKYNTFQNRTDLERLCQNEDKLTIKDVQIKNPNNPVKLKDAKLIIFQK
jgi:hypothetical protein